MTTLSTVVATYRGGMHFSGDIGGHGFAMDYPTQPGQVVAGPKPMDMLLASLASCAGGSVAALMRRTGQSFRALTVTARGQRRSEHPTVFTEIGLEFVFEGDLDPAAVEKVVAQAESHVCPVWAMLKPSTPIRATIRVGTTEELKN